MTEIPTSGATNEARRQTILRQAEGRYGADALFVYPRRQQKDFVAMTLADAMAICGEYMVDEDPELLWSTLDKWHATAGLLAEKSPALINKARALGRNVLNERGIEVGDDGGDTTE